jgi:hypothetical protein
MTLTADIDTSFEHLYQDDGWSGAGLVRGLRLGEPQVEGPLCIRPLFSECGEETGGQPETPAEYVTLRQALAEGTLEVGEVSEEGRVTELLFINRGDTRVLALDGEHLAAAGLKQDRVTAIPFEIERFATLRVPVCCVARNMWGVRASRWTGDCDFVAERAVRLAMKRSTLASMRAGMGVYADQGAVWSGVESLHRRHATVSGTRAMKDVYAAKKAGLTQLLRAFPCEEEQVGVLVIQGQQVVGLDYVSQPNQYREIHERLLRSYALEALVSDSAPGDGSLAETFLEGVAGLHGEPFDSIGLGSDVRYVGDGVLGHALVVDGRVVHASLFATDPGGDPNGGRREGEPVERDIAGCPVYPRGEDVRRAYPRQGDAAGDVEAPATADSRRAGDVRVDHSSAPGHASARPVEAASVVARALRFADYVRSLPGLDLVPFQPYEDHIGALLVDVALQRGINYQRVVVPRARRFMTEHPDARTTSTLSALLATSDPHLLLRWRGTAAITTLAALTRLLLDEGVETISNLRAWVDLPGSRDKLLAVPNVGFKTASYVALLAGSPNAVPVDRHLRRHLERSGVRPGSYDDAVDVYRKAAALLGVSPATLEWSLFSLSTSRARRQP